MEALPLVTTVSQSLKPSYHFKEMYNVWKRGWALEVLLRRSNTTSCELQSELERENIPEYHDYEHSRDKDINPQLKGAQFVPSRNKTYVNEIGKYQREKP